MIARETRRWVRHRAAAILGAHRARRAGLGAACAALWALNRYAKSWGDRTRIYALKDALVAQLVRSGHRFTAELHVQTRACWGWRGDDVCLGTSCTKCRGSGVYGRSELYLLRFVVDGQAYEWHQPRSTLPGDVFVRIPAAVRNGEGSAWQQPGHGDAGSSRLTLLELETHVATIRAHLTSAGVRLPAVDEGLTLSEAARIDWANLQLGFEHQVERLRWWWWNTAIGAVTVVEHPVSGELTVQPPGTVRWGACDECGCAAWLDFWGNCPTCDTGLPF